MYTIRNRYGGIVVEIAEADNVRDAVVEAVRKGHSLSGAQLSGADLSDLGLANVDLTNADLTGCWMPGVDLGGASCHLAIFDGAIMRKASLRGAVMPFASFVDTVLDGADMRFTVLDGCIFKNASLAYVSFGGADLRGTATFHGADFGIAPQIPPHVACRYRIVPDGTIVGWKKCRGGVIVKLRVPEESPRTNGPSRVCRAKWAQVIKTLGGTDGISFRDPTIVYRENRFVGADDYDPRPIDDAAGISFFITREEAEEFEYEGDR